MFAFILEWIWFLLFIVFVIGATASVHHRLMGYGIFCFIATVGVAYYAWEAPIKSYVAVHGVILSALAAVGWYLVASIVTSVIYWLFYCIGVRNRYATLVDSSVGLVKVVEYLRQKHSFPKGVDGADVSLSLLNVAKRYMHLDNAFANSDKVYQSLFLIDANSGLANSSLYKVNSSLLPGGDVEKLFATLDPDSIAEGSDLLAQRQQEQLAMILPPKLQNHKKLVIYSSLLWPFTLLDIIAFDLVESLVTWFVDKFSWAFNALSKVVFGQV